MTLKAHHFASRDAAQSHYLAVIDAAAAKARHVDPAQETLYQQKLQEARQYGGPLLLAEAEATGSELKDVVDAVLRERARWEQRAHNIEIQRIKAKAAVRGASTAAAMHAIHQQFEAGL